MAAEKQWEDQGWTKTRYQKEPIWEEVGSHIADIVEATCEADDFVELGQKQKYEAVARQVMLVIYSNLQHRFDPDRDKIKELTSSQQSHWNFMLLGKLGDSEWTGTTEEADRIEQPVTRYFLCKLIHRLRLHGWEIDWDSIAHELERGCRWRVMTSPASAEPRAQWLKDYGSEPKPTVDYPSPWSIANSYKVVVNHPKPIIKDEGFPWETVTEKKIWPCRVQNDGIFFIQPEGKEATDDDGVPWFNLWVIKGLEGKDSFERDAEKDVDRLRQMLTGMAKHMDDMKADLEAYEVQKEQLRSALEEANAEISRLKDQMASPLELRIVIDPVTGAVRHIS